MRKDDYLDKREHLADLSEEELKERFWKLADELMDPVIELARKNTSPSIERSVLLRMGFSSMEATAIVEGVIDRGLIGKGAGHVVYRLAKDHDMEIRDAGLKLADGEMWDEVLEIFEGAAE